MRLMTRVPLAGLGLIVSGFAAALAFGTAPAPAELKSISSPFKSVDFSKLPPLQQLAVPHGRPIAYRQYGAADARDVVLALHGSTASSASLHPLATALISAGMAVYVPDVRGHGATGTRGDLDYAGQLDDDMIRLSEFIAKAHPDARRTLLGFSIGGGLALKTAAGRAGANYARTVLMAPALGRHAETQRIGGDAWASPYIGRIIATSLLNRAGIHAFDGLPAIQFAVPANSEAIQTAEYSHRLLYGLMPEDHRPLLRNLRMPVTVLIAENDELFSNVAFEPAVRPSRPDAKIVQVSGSDHIGLTVLPQALDALVRELR
jgi:non-heme chloroperoxidase